MTTNEATAADLEAFLTEKRKSEAHLGSDDLEILKRERNNLSYLIYAYFVLVAGWFYVVGAYSSKIGSHPSLRLFAPFFLVAGAALLNNRYRKLEGYLYFFGSPHHFGESERWLTNQRIRRSRRSRQLGSSRRAFLSS